MRSRVLRRLSPHLKRAYLKLGLKSRQQSPRIEIRSESRFSELLKHIIRLGEAKFNSHRSESSENKSFSDIEPEILDTEFDVSVNNTEVFDELSGSGDESLQMSTTQSTTFSTTQATTPSTSSSTAPRRKPWIKRRRITYRPAFKGLTMRNVDFRYRNRIESTFKTFLLILKRCLTYFIGIR